MRIAITYNAVTDQSAPDERDVLVQVQAVAEALTKLGHDAVPLACDLDLETVRRRIERIRPDYAFNLVESLAGSGRLISVVPALLDAMAIAYTGAPAAAVYITSHKVLAKEKMRAAGLPTPDWIGPYPHERCSKYAIHPPTVWHQGPWIIKSVWEHASLGLSGDGLVFAEKAQDLMERLQLRAPELGGACFAETYIDGREFNLSILGGVDGPKVLPIAEILFEGYQENKPRIVCYNAKWNETSFEYSHTPRRFDFPPSESSLLNSLERVAIRCWHCFGLRGYARVDFRVDHEGRLSVLEVNTNPCLSPDAGFAAAVDRSGMSFEQTVERILEDALKTKEPLSAKGPSNDLYPVSMPEAAFRYDPCRRDAEDIRDIITATGFFHAYEVDVAVELVEDRLAKGPESDYYFVFLEKDDRLVGYACYGPIPCTASSYDIYWIAVAPVFQRKGFGRVILKETERLIRKAGGTRIYIDTSQSETYDATRAFYARCGYEFESIMEDFYAPGDGKVVCCKSLARVN